MYLVLHQWPIQCLMHRACTATAHKRTAPNHCAPLAQSPLSSAQGQRFERAQVVVAEKLTGNEDIPVRGIGWHGMHL